MRSHFRAPFPPLLALAPFAVSLAGPSSSGPLKSKGPEAQPQASLLHLPSCWEECLWPPAFPQELMVPTGHIAHPLCPVTHDSDDHPCPWHLSPKEAKTDS